MKFSKTIGVIGVLNTVLGAVGTMLSAFSLVWMAVFTIQNAELLLATAGSLYGWLLLQITLTFVGCVLMLLSGVGLMRRLPWARRATIACAAYTLAWIGLANAIKFALMWAGVQAGSLVGPPFWSALWMSYWIAVLYLVTRPQVKQVLEAPRPVAAPLE